MNRHGTRYRLSRDLVLSMMCETWPECASEWLTRERKHGWPSAELIDKCKSMGFLVVPVGHPSSDEPYIQWRIAFSHQELLLVRDFNSVQMKCFVILKFIKKEYIQRFIKEETLSSYHCKTCMFYCIENTPIELWVPENLAYCVLICLRQLCLWVSKDNCPNYFIPGENMFDRIRSDALKKGLLINLRATMSTYENHTKDLLKRLMYFASRLRITMESKQIINDELELTANQLVLSNEDVWKQYQIGFFTSESIVSTLIDLMMHRNKFISTCLDAKLDNFIDILQSKVTELEQTKTVTDHTEEESQEVITLILPFLQLSLLALRVVETLENRAEKLAEIVNHEKWAALNAADGSSKLKQACAMLMLGYPNLSTNILASTLQIGSRKKQPLCGCYDNLPKPLSYIITGVPLKQQNIIKVLCNLYQPCVVFLPNEYRITPMAVNYEMLRTCGTPPHNTNNILFRYWYNWGFVEGIFLTQFLLYMKHIALEQESLATKAIGNMIRICNKKYPWHFDTSLNLLGWVFKERGDVARAVECFQKSMRTQPTYNAACWHLCFLICFN